MEQFEEKVQRYADLAIKIGVNIQPGQRLLIRGPLLYGAPISTAPLVNALVKSAYQAGARRVDVLWGDESNELARFQYAPRDSFAEMAAWKSGAAFEHVSQGDAVIGITGINPDLLKGLDADMVTTYTQAIQKALAPFQNLTSTNQVQWLVLPAPTPGWAAKVFPSDMPGIAMEKMWMSLFAFSRLDRPDPVAAWREHTNNLKTRSAYLNAKQYAGFHYRGPDTDLTIGFTGTAVWTGASEHSASGVEFIANMPTEEVFAAPHRMKADGFIHASLPLNYSGTLIDNFDLRFEKGRVVNATAKVGETVLRKLLDTDDGAGRLGEVALVPHSSPISQSGTLFYNTLLDENASCHLAVGRAYQTTLQGGGNWSDEEFNSQGGNTSLVHVDFMVGSSKLDIDGILPDGRVEPVFRSGEWAFKA